MIELYDEHYFYALWALALIIGFVGLLAVIGCLGEMMAGSEE